MRVYHLFDINIIKPGLPLERSEKNEFFSRAKQCFGRFFQSTDLSTGLEPIIWSKCDLRKKRLLDSLTILQVQCTVYQDTWMDL